jgi:hypothetical protein
VELEQAELLLHERIAYVFHPLTKRGSAVRRDDEVDALLKSGGVLFAVSTD